jgi:hypothetical protein
VPAFTYLSTRERLALTKAIGDAIAHSLETGEAYTVISFVTSPEYFAVSVRELLTTKFAPHIIETMAYTATVTTGDRYPSLSVVNSDVPTRPSDVGDWVITHRALGTTYVRRFATEKLAREYARRVDAGFYDLKHEPLVAAE